MDIFILAVTVFGLASASDLNYMNETIRSYFADTRHHVVNIAYKARAKQFIYNEFKRLGLETVYHNFTYNGNDFSNVIGIKQGSAFGTSQDKIIGVVAHYDTVSTSKGVDDNGAGVAAMLEVAKQLKDFKFKNTIIYLAPDLEETLLTGSSKFVSEWLPTWAIQSYDDLETTTKNAQGCIVMDTMMEYNTSANSQTLPEGAEDIFRSFFPNLTSNLLADTYQGDFLLLIYRAAEDKHLADAFTSSWSAEDRSQFELEYLGIPSALSALPEVVSDNLLRSDHKNFWYNSIPAIFITDSANFRGDMISCYHQQCDNLEVMLTDDNLMFLGKTADAIARTLKGKSVVTSSNTRMEACFYVLALSMLVLEVLFPTLY